MFKLLLNKITKEDFNFLKLIVTSLPDDYAYLIQQISKDFILGKKVNPLGENGTYTLLLNANLANIYKNNLHPEFFIIKDIFIWNKKKSIFENVELHIIDGILQGFRINAKYRDLDYSRLDVTRVKEKYFKNDDKECLMDILGDIPKEVYDLLDINASFKIETLEGEFYTLKELGDGNYISVDLSGAIFRMIHDPYVVEKIYENKDLFFEDLLTKRFFLKS